MAVIQIDAARLRDWETFHSVFALELGFPSFYGKNMNAWIDCMSAIDDPDGGMTTVHASPGDPVVLRLENVSAMPWRSMRR